MRLISMVFILILISGTLWSVWNPDAGNLAEVSASLDLPSWHSWLGRDALGRDLLSRVFQGAQVSVGVGIFSSMAALLLGVTYGAISALSPRPLDAVFMRFAEVLMALPSLMLMAVFALVLQTQVFDSSLVVLFGALSLGSWMPISRITRNLILQEKQKDYVEAARALGAKPSRIFRKHIFPNLLSPLLTYWSVQIPHAVLAEGLLSFLGFGVKSPGVSWGVLLQEGWKTLASYPHLLLGPSLFLFLTVFSLNVLLENFRHNLNPKLKWERFS